MALIRLITTKGSLAALVDMFRFRLLNKSQRTSELFCLMLTNMHVGCFLRNILSLFFYRCSDGSKKNSITLMYFKTYQLRE